MITTSTITSQTDKTERLQHSRGERKLTNLRFAHNTRTELNWTDPSSEHVEYLVLFVEVHNLNEHHRPSLFQRECSQSQRMNWFWAPTVLVSPQPIKSWHWHVWPINASTCCRPVQFSSYALNKPLIVNVRVDVYFSQTYTLSGTCIRLKRTRTATYQHKKQSYIKISDNQLRNSQFVVQRQGESWRRAHTCNTLTHESNLSCVHTGCNIPQQAERTKSQWDIAAHHGRCQMCTSWEMTINNWLK